MSMCHSVRRSLNRGVRACVQLLSSFLTEVCTFLPFSSIRVTIANLVVKGPFSHSQNIDTLAALPQSRPFFRCCPKSALIGAALHAQCCAVCLALSVTTSWCSLAAALSVLQSNSQQVHSALRFAFQEKHFALALNA